jgi:hypothetical protein
MARQETVRLFGKQVSFRCECFGWKKLNAKLLRKENENCYAISRQSYACEEIMVK